MGTRTPSPRLPLFSIRLSASAKHRWSDAAKHERRTLAGYIKHAVESYLARGDGRDNHTEWPIPRSAHAGNLPSPGQYVLACDPTRTFADGWNVARFRGADYHNPAFVWDFDTHGCALEGVDLWVPLPSNHANQAEETTP